jgi:sugar phosphate isomerase/epimerase
MEAGVPFYGKQAAEARDLLKSLGLSSPSGTFGAKDEDEWARAAENAKVLGAEYMIATVPREWSKSLDGWKRAADMLNRRGRISKEAGLALAYHNHHFEFKEFEGVVAYDQLLKSTDPALVKMEIDIFWATYAGQDPLAWFDRYPGRFPLWHVKDLKPGQKPSTDQVPGNPFAEVGTGIIDWKRIFSGARKAGLRYYFIEQDNWDRPPLESARMSCEFMKKFQV